MKEIIGSMTIKEKVFKPYVEEAERLAKVLSKLPPPEAIRMVDPDIENKVQVEQTLYLTFSTLHYFINLYTLQLVLSPLCTIFQLKRHWKSKTPFQGQILLYYWRHL
jgi:hypothetical protein